MALHIKKSQSAVLLVAEKMCLQLSSELFVAEVVVSHVERQPVPQTWSGGGKVPVSITAFGRGTAVTAHVWTSADRHE